MVGQNASGAGQLANPLRHPAPLAHIFQHSSPLAEAVICGLAHTTRTAHTAHIACISPIAQFSRSTAAVVSAALHSAATMENPNSIPPASPLSIVTIPPRALPPSLSSVAVAVPAPMSSTVAAAAATAHREAIRREGERRKPSQVKFLASQLILAMAGCLGIAEQGTPGSPFLCLHPDS